MGYERLCNHALSITEREAFIHFMNAGQAVRPANCEAIVAINQGRSALTVHEPVVTALTPSEVAAQIASSAVVVDTRSQDAFGAGHIPGALNLQLHSREFEQRVGWIAPPEVPLVLVLSAQDRASPALHKLAFIGLDARVTGVLEGGMQSWVAAGRPTTTIPQVSVAVVAARLREEHAPQVLDVRECGEWDAGHIQDAVHASYRSLQERLAELPLDPERPTAVVCAGGVRSSIACSILLRRGFRSLFNVIGGMTAWRRADLPVHTD
jgi:hydroxyacylglutathione hydrolase